MFSPNRHGPFSGPGERASFGPARATSWILIIAAWFGLLPQIANAETSEADGWLTGQVVYPASAGVQLGQRDGFEQLHAEAILDRYILYKWTPARLDTNTTVTLVLSADEPGHWPVRDWREYPMTLSGPAWTARPPVDSSHVPLVYFVRAVAAATTNISTMRVCHPDTAGLSAPTRPFDPFLEGFENGSASWTLVTDKSENPQLETDSAAHSGYHSLKVSLKTGQHSATVATTRVRGWQLVENQVVALKLWLRTKSGNATARFTLQADAFTSAQVVATSTQETRLTAEWQKVIVPLESFPKLPLSRVDWFTIEFIGTGPLDCLIDDLQLLAPVLNESK